MIHPVSAAAAAAVLLAAGAAAEPVACGSFSIDFDFSAIDALTPIIKGEATPEDVEAALTLQGVQAMVRKTQQYAADVSDDDMRAVLTTLASGGEPEADPFHLAALRDEIDEIQADADELRADPAVLIAPACERLKRYAPASFDGELKTIFVLGVRSAGFTFGDPTLHIGFHRMHDDLPGLELVLVHELYHGVQGSYVQIEDGVAESLSPTEKAALDHIFNLYLEGSATWVADPAAYEGDGDMLRFFKDRLDRGQNELRNLFTLYEAVLYRLAHDETADVELNYFAGFTNEEHFYNVGYAMARKLEQDGGPEAVAGLIDVPPTQFILRYAGLDEKPAFTEAALKIVRALDTAIATDDD